MGIHTKIVEFMGPAACGKSTLCDLLRDYFVEKNVPVANWNDLVNDLKKQNFFVKIRCVSFVRLFRYLRMFRLAKPERQWRRYLLFYFFKIDILYMFAKKYSNYNFVFVEHGILQNVISTQTGTELFKEDRFLLKLITLLNHVGCVDFCVYCSLNVDEALLRMLKRNRFDGRIDKEKNVARKKQMLQRDADNCLVLFGCVNECVKNCVSKQLDTHQSPESLFQNILPLFIE